MYSIGFDIFARDHASQTFDKLGDKATGSASKMQKAGGLAGKALLGIAGAAVLFGKQSVGAYSESEEAQKQLAFAFQKFPALADTNQAALQALNSELQKKTRFDDDNIASGQAVLAGFKLTGTQLKEVTPLLLDYAAKTGKDVPAAAMDVGKALLGNAKALKNIGISYKSTGDSTKDFANITALMQSKVGGFANNEAATAAGKLAILKNQFGELEETVGKQLMPVLSSLVGVGLKVVDFISRNSTAVGIGIGVITTMIGVVWGINAAAKAYWATQMALNIVLTANPIGLVVAGLVLLGAGLVMAYKHSATFRAVVQGAFHGIAEAARWMWNSVIAPVIRFLLQGFSTVASFYAAMLRGLSHVPGFGWARTAADALQGAANKANNLRSAVQNIPSNKTITVTVREQLAASAHSAAVRSALQWRAAGGPVQAGRPYVVGEHRAELFVPDSNGTILPSVPRGGGPGPGGMTVIQVVLDGKIISEWVVNNGRALQQGLLKTKRQQGGAALGVA